MADIHNAFNEEASKQFVTKLTKKVWHKTLPDFDHNCKKRLYGFIQGAMYRLMDDGAFQPNFLVKRKREIPKGDIDVIAKVIVEFIPIWEIFRSPENDFWCSVEWT